MRAAVHRVDVVGEAENGFRIGIVVLQGHFDLHLTQRVRAANPLETDRLVVQDALALAQVFDKLGDAALIAEVMSFVRTLVPELNLQAPVQEG